MTKFVMIGTCAEHDDNWTTLYLNLDGKLSSLKFSNKEILVLDSNVMEAFLIKLVGWLETVCDDGLVRSKIAECFACDVNKAFS